MTRNARVFAARRCDSNCRFAGSSLDSAALESAVMTKSLLIPILLVSASFRGEAIDVFDSPGPGYRQQIERQQIERAVPQVKVVREPTLPNVSRSVPLTHPRYAPFPSATSLHPDHSVPPLSPSVINAFSEPIRLISK